MECKEKQKLTKRQEEILWYINSFIEKYGYPPTRKEMADYYEMNENAISDHEKALIKKGYIRRDRHVSRGIVVL